LKKNYDPNWHSDVARELVGLPKAAGGQNSIHTFAFQVRSSDRFSEIIAWIAGHLAKNFSRAVS